MSLHAVGTQVRSLALRNDSVDRGSVLRIGQALRPGWYLKSANGECTLVMRPGGDLVLFHGSKAIWSSHTAGDNGSIAILQGDGNFVVRLHGVTKWSANTRGFQGDIVRLQNDVNLVISQGAHRLWDFASGYLGDTLRNGTTLTAGEKLSSRSHTFDLIMQGDGNLVLYQGSKALWYSNTAGDNGASVTMQGDGNLVIYLNGVAKWSSNTVGFSRDYLRLQNDNNLVIYQGDHPVWDWASGYLGDTLTSGLTLTPGEQLASQSRAYDLIMQGDGNLVLYQGSKALWSSGVAGTGSWAGMQGDGNFVVYNNGNAMWSSSTAGYSGARLVLQNDNNLVIYQGSTPLWDWSSGLLVDGGSGGGNATAVQWAQGHLGEVYGSSTEQRADQHQWSGFCWTFVYDAFGGKVPREETAQDAFNYFSARGMVQQGAPPAGSVAFYSAAGGGHAAVGVGGGQIVGTRGYDTNRESVFQTGYRNINPSYLGYVIP